MTGVAFRPIAELVEPVTTWNPFREEPADTFMYVDLSAVDQELKQITYAREVICTEAPSRARQIVKAGDILVSTVRPNLNGVAKVPAELDSATASTGFCVLRPNSALLDSSYLFHWVKSPLFVSDMVRKATGASYPAVSDKIVMASQLPYLSVTEQRRIAAILDQADALRAKRREALAQLDSLTQSIFIEMFGDPATNPKGWTTKKIGDLLESASYGTSEKSGPEGRFPVLRMNNITRTGEIDMTDLKYMDLAESEYDRYLVKTGDILFNRTNSAELVGKTAIYRHTENAAYAGYLIRLRTNADNDPEYLGRFLNTAFAKRMLRAMCKSIIGMANINATEIQSMKIAQPPFEIQQEFGRRVRAVEMEKSTHRKSLTELDGLFTSLQHRAFRGAL
jgi:type I restriction enzyme S subunit